MSNKPFEFEQSLKELEQITLWFESTDVDLDQGLVKFERGMELAGQLKGHLATVENRVEKIKQRFSASPAGTQPAASDPAATPTDAADSAAPTADTIDDTEQTGLFR